MTARIRELAGLLAEADSPLLRDLGIDVQVVRAIIIDLMRARAQRGEQARAVAAELLGPETDAEALDEVLEWGATLAAVCSGIALAATTPTAVFDSLPPDR